MKIRIKRIISHKIFTLSCCVCLLAFLKACDGESPEGASGGNDDEVILEESHSKLLDTIELNNGTTIAFEEGPEESVVMVIQGQAGTESEIDSLIDGNTSIKNIYATLAPEKEIPPAIKTVLERKKSFNINNTQLPIAAPSVTDSPLYDSADRLSMREKAVSRDVDYFRNVECYNDVLVEQYVFYDWYRKLDKCQTERTGDFDKYYYDVRQTYMAVRPYRGIVYMGYYIQTGGGWVYGNSFQINEGAYFRAVIYPPAPYAKMNVRLSVYNASSDGYHYAIHSAKADATDMKGDNGTDYFHIICACPVYNSNNDMYFQVESCLANNSQQAMNNGAIIACGLLADRLELVPNCLPLGYERVADESVNCNASTSQEFRECWDPNIGAECDYECRDLCTPPA